MEQQILAPVCSVSLSSPDLWTMYTAVLKGEVERDLSGVQEQLLEQVDVWYINADVRWLTEYRLAWANPERKPSTCHSVKETVSIVIEIARYLIWDAAERAKAGIKVGPDVLRDVQDKSLSFMPLARPRESVGMISDSNSPPFSSPAYLLSPICNESRSGKSHVARRFAKRLQTDR